MIFRVNKNTISAYGVIYDGNGVEFLSYFNQLEKEYQNIIVKLHTYGGSVFDGNLIYNAIQDSKANVEIHIVGVAASMGAVISLSRKVVKMVENGYLMIHAPSGWVDGTADEMEKYANLLRSIESNFTKKLISRTGKNEAYVGKWLKGDNWFDANQALQEKLISGIIEPEAEIEAFDPEPEGMVNTYNRFAALLLPEGNTQKTNSENLNMKQPIITALGLVGVSAESSDTAVIEAVKNHYQTQIDTANANLQKEKTAREDAEKKLNEQAEAAINALVDEADKTAKFTAEQKETYKAIGKSAGIDALKTVLATVKPKQTIMGTITGGKETGTVEGRADWDFDKWQKEDPRGWEALAESNPEQFQEVFNKKFKK